MIRLSWNRTVSDTYRPRLEDLEGRFAPGDILFGMTADAAGLVPGLSLSVFSPPELEPASTGAVVSYTDNTALSLEGPGTAQESTAVHGTASAAEWKGDQDPPAAGVGDLAFPALASGFQALDTADDAGFGRDEPGRKWGDLFVTSYNNDRLLSYDVATGAGTILQTGGGLDGPCQMAFTRGRVFIANQVNSTIGRFDVRSGVYTTFASGGGLSGPTGVVISADRGTLYVSSQFNGTIFKYDVATGTGSTFATGV